MGLRDAVLQAFGLLWAHKGRSLLTLFGLVWGTASVIFLVGWGQGVSIMLEDGFFKAGKNLGQLWAGRIGEDYTPAVDRRYLWFNYDDVKRLRRLARRVDLIAAETRQWKPITFRQRNLSLETRGVEPAGLAIRDVPVAAGRGILPSDLDQRRRVLVLGAKVRRQLLGAEGGIGSWVRVDGVPFQVVGVLERMGTQLARDGQEIDDQAWIPITTFHARWPQPWTSEFFVSTILYRVRDRHQWREAEEEVRAIIAERLGVSPTDEEAVKAWSPIETLEQIPLDQTEGLMFILAAATLVIGGVGTLNLMLDSVHERRSEIGVRLAVGARPRDVLGQFFLETFTVVSVGGGAGVLLGVLGCLFLGSLDRPDLIPVPVLSLNVVGLALSVMAAVGFLAGVVPAWRASRVDPAITLRMD